MSQSNYPEYITKEDILKFTDLSINESDNVYDACRLIKEYIKNEFNKESEIRYINDTIVVHISSNIIEFEDLDIYVVPNINENKIETQIPNKKVIQSEVI